MRFGGIGRQIFLVFLAVLTGYAVVFSLIQHQRAGKGPWLITFATETGEPTLVISQPTLDLREVKIVFSGQSVGTNLTQTVDFSEPRGVPFAIPFGECVFFDGRFLPGTLVFQMFGHEIQLLPRVLTIDKVERPWKSGEVIRLEPATNRPDKTP
jgi:hypothetical protein